MSNKEDVKVLSQVKPSRIILPILIGIGVSIFVVNKEWDKLSFSDIEFTWSVLLLLIMAFVMMLSRDVGYIIRLKILAGDDLTWRQAIKIVFLWEFASSVTPTAIGGTSVALLFLYKENLSLGKGSTIVLATSFLDELYFIIMLPLFISIVGWNRLFGELLGSDVAMDTLWDSRYFLFAVGGYSIKFIYVLIVSYGLFIQPITIKRLLLLIFKLPYIRRWRGKIEQTGDELIVASKVLKGKSFGFWAKAFIATFCSWTSRYWVANFIILAVVVGVAKGDEYNSIYSVIEQSEIFVIQLVMWVMMMVMPSPGGSGFSEVIFMDCMDTFIPIGFVAVVALLWRFVSYYPYLIIGSIILPNWIRTKFNKRSGVDSEPDSDLVSDSDSDSDLKLK